MNRPSRYSVAVLYAPSGSNNGFSIFFGFRRFCLRPLLYCCCLVWCAGEQPEIIRNCAGLQLVTVAAQFSLGLSCSRRSPARAPKVSLMLTWQCYVAQVSIPPAVSPRVIAPRAVAPSSFRRPRPAICNLMRRNYPDCFRGSIRFRSTMSIGSVGTMRRRKC